MVRFFIFISVGLMIGYAYVLTNGLWFFEGMDANEKGVFGDSWGAFTSIFSAFGFCGILWTIHLQMVATKKIEKDNRKRESSEKIRDFENSFFNMMNILQTIIRDMRVTNSEKGIRAEGRHVFLYFYKAFKVAVVKNKSNLYFDHKDFLSIKQAELRMSNSFRSYFMNRAQNLSHYYRFVYNIFKFIDGSDLSDSQKKKYANILRAQLSDYELLMLFYNGLSPNGKKFIQYFNKYALLDNLPVNKLISKSHVVFCSSPAWGENEEALRYFI